tara:strand:+ start:15574 stop:16449 length:876 start_codon:yes stop_codon:yes gene_type:complete
VNKIFQNLYLFSKLSFVFILFIILFILIYLFYKSYTLIPEENTTNKIQNDELLESINLNSSKIVSIEKLINNTNSKLENMENLIKAFDTNNKEQNNDQLNKTIDKINNELNKINLELNKLINNNELDITKKNLDENINVNKRSAIELILIKFESGSDFSNELNLLSEIVGIDKNHLIEKLFLLNDKQYNGKESLLLSFKEDTNNFISDNFLGDNSLIRGLLPYIKLEPSNKNELQNEKLIIINNAFIEIENSNYEKSFKLLETIDDKNNYYNLTLQQLDLAIKFNNAIKKL